MDALICNGCRKAGASVEIQDLFGSFYHPECYILYLPPWAEWMSRDGVDPALDKAERIVGPKRTREIYRDLHYRIQGV